MDANILKTMTRKTEKKRLRSPVWTGPERQPTNINILGEVSVRIPFCLSPWKAKIKTGEQECCSRSSAFTL